MCLSIPMRVIHVEGCWGDVEAAGVRRRVGLDYVPEARPGDYVLVHAGVALQVVDVQEALETLRLLEEAAAAAAAASSPAGGGGPEPGCPEGSSAP